MKNYKGIRLVYFAVVTVLAIIICLLYSDKKMFENRYNREFYFDFKTTYLIDQPPFYDSLETVDKAVSLKELSREDIYFSFDSSILINNRMSILKEFYSDCYGYNREKYYSNKNLQTIDQYIFKFGLREGYFNETNKGTFILKEDIANEFKQEMVDYLEIIEIVEQFKIEYKSYFAKLDLNGGKNFIKDGIWLVLYNEINDYINESR